MTKLDLIMAFLASSNVVAKPGRVPSLVLGDLTLTLYSGRKDCVLHMTETETGLHVFTHVRWNDHITVQLFQEKLLSLGVQPAKVTWQFAVNKTLETLSNDLSSRQALLESVKKPLETLENV